MNTESLDTEQFASTIIGCLQTEYPHKLDHVLEGSADLVAPSALHPAFFGSYDWHSSVHNFWSLAHLLREYPSEQLDRQIRPFLDGRLTPEIILTEHAYFSRPAQVAAERPYGRAWLVYLYAEIATHQDDDFSRWEHALRPFEELMWSSLRTYLDQLPAPILGGSYDSTALCLSLMYRSARMLGRQQECEWIRRRSSTWFVDACSPGENEVRYGDFLPPELIIGDLISTTQEPSVLSRWLDGAYDEIVQTGSEGALDDVDSSDPDGVHEYGVKLGRAWTLHGIANGLPDSDERKAVIRKLAAHELRQGLQVTTTGNFLSDHWLPTFALFASYRAREITA